jgi:hypothetical protein
VGPNPIQQNLRIQNNRRDDGEDKEKCEEKSQFYNNKIKRRVDIEN